MSNSDLADYLKLRIAEANARLQAVNRIVRHSTSKGNIGEDVLRDIVNDFLPAACRASNGFVVELQHGELKQSGQIDVLVYDRSESVPLYHDKNLVVVTSDMACLAIEIKTRMNKTQLRESIAGAQSVKQLANAATAVIWAFQGMTIRTLKKHLSELLNGIPYESWPDQIFNLNRGYVLARPRSEPAGNKWTAFYGRDFVAKSFFQTVLFAAKVENLTSLIESIKPDRSDSF